MNATEAVSGKQASIEIEVDEALQPWGSLQ